MRLVLVCAALLSTAALADDGPRDPFAPFSARVVAPGAQPLQRYALEEMKVRGIVAGTASPRALIETPDGVAHIARVGTLVGTSWGRIAAIRGDTLVIEETLRDAVGGLHRRRVDLRVGG